MPPALANKPDLHEGLDWYLDAFWDLSSDRPLGAMGGAGRIPFTAIDRWARRFGVDDPDAFDRLMTFVGALDATFLKLAAERDPPDKS